MLNKAIIRPNRNSFLVPDIRLKLGYNQSSPSPWSGGLTLKVSGSIQWHSHNVLELRRKKQEKSRRQGMGREKRVMHQESRRKGCRVRKQPSIGKGK